MTLYYNLARLRALTGRSRSTIFRDRQYGLISEPFRINGRNHWTNHQVLFYLKRLGVSDPFKAVEDYWYGVSNEI